MLLKDDLGREVALPGPARRVIALYGAYSEMFLAMGLEHLLVARTDADGKLPALAGLPSVGTHMRPNLELIVGLRPDLVLQMGGRAEAEQSVHDLERLGVPVAFFDVRSFDSLFSVMERLGWMVGHEERASSLVATLRERLEKVALALVAIHDRPSVFFEVRSGNLLAAGRGSMVSEIIEKAGGSNCIQGDEKLVRINEEEVLRLAPEVYLTQLGPMNPNPAPLEARPRFAALPAALNHRSYTVDERMFSRPGPGNVDAVERLAALLHPEAFGAPNQ